MPHIRIKETGLAVVLSASTLTLVPDSGEYRRYHRHETGWGKKEIVKDLDFLKERALNGDCKEKFIGVDLHT